ncbi:hypothetical protein JOB18_036058 [Solea senegalensis]|uniref:Uncharacterized protein n=1 Tax=Solea senegalensis TaxID=28829 RepID=A0AAV6R1U4_SOLSE|nr:hypothetical protein JOB18_036058 [Solea senegalensis]
MDLRQRQSIHVIGFKSQSVLFLWHKLRPPPPSTTETGSRCDADVSSNQRRRDRVPKQQQELVSPCGSAHWDFVEK